MGCTDCKSKKNIKLNNTISNNFKIDHNLPNTALFSGFWGKILYFMILMLIALTPIINFAAIYMFYIAVFSKNVNKKVKNAEESKNIDEA
mgnify:CR=1 FL=1|jgi:hypothetical protein